MRKTREILRLKLTQGLSNRAVGRSVGCGPSTVSRTATRARLLGLTWDKIVALDDTALEERMYGSTDCFKKRGRELPDPAHIQQELRRPGVTLELLHIEYLQENPEGYRYTSFCNHYRQWQKNASPVMRQNHVGGDKLFVDYSGKKPSIIDVVTGEVTPVELFVAVLGASNYTYAEATLTQQSQDWIGSHVRALEFFEGVPSLLVPDQLRSGVSRPCRYEAGPQRVYEELSHHYHCAILPARPYRPRDKAKVEVGVQIVQRWILACLRNELFYSLSALNRRIRELLDKLNTRPMRGYGGLSRREMFERCDKPALKPLPKNKFEYAEWKKVKVNIDYHVDIVGHYYSVPYQWVGETLEARFTATTVEIIRNNRRVVSHPRSNIKGKHTTNSEHMPKAHRAHAEWSPGRIIGWAETIGPHTKVLVEAILKSRPHPEMGYRSCLGILRLSKTYDASRLEAACERGLRVNARSYRDINAILKNGLDKIPMEDEPERQQQLPLHDNVRGADYYH